MKYLRIVKHKNIYQILYLVFICATLHGQVNLCTEIKAAHLAYNNIGGVQLASGLEFISNKNTFSIKGHLIYAVGNREFDKIDGEYYTLVDGANRQDYPLPGILPGLPESAYIKVFDLASAKTMDVGFTISYGRTVLSSDKSNLRLNLGLDVSWIEESSILYEYNGDLENVLGIIHDIYLVTPFTQNFFDLGPQLSIKYELISKNNNSFGVVFDSSWLINSGFKFSFGPAFSIPLYTN